MNKAEDFKTINDFNRSLKSDLPEVAFTRWYELGSIVEDLGKKERRLKNNTLPTNKCGIYVLGLKPDGSEHIYMIYLGVASGESKSAGIRNRVRNHFSYSQNDTLGIESGPLACARAVNMRGQYYSSYHECNNSELCDRYESVILYKYDFAFNLGKKQVRMRRISDIVKLCEPVANNNYTEVVETMSVSTCSLESVVGLPERRWVVKTATRDSFSIANCGCGKKFHASQNIQVIECNCGSKFTFNVLK